MADTYEIPFEDWIEHMNELIASGGIMVVAVLPFCQLFGTLSPQLVGERRLQFPLVQRSLGDRATSALTFDLPEAEGARYERRVNEHGTMLSVVYLTQTAAVLHVTDSIDFLLGAGFELRPH